MQHTLARRSYRKQELASSHRQELAGCHGQELAGHQKQKQAKRSNQNAIRTLVADRIHKEQAKLAERTKAQVNGRYSYFELFITSSGCVIFQDTFT